jgi:hypothetical protein
VFRQRLAERPIGTQFSLLRVACGGGVGAGAPARLCGCLQVCGVFAVCAGRASRLIGPALNPMRTFMAFGAAGGAAAAPRRVADLGLHGGGSQGLSPFAVGRAAAGLPV